MNKKKYPISRKEDIVMQHLESEILIYDLKANKAFCLNETSTLVWQACDGNHSISEISQDLSNQLNQPISQDLVWLALDQMKREKLLTNSGEVKSSFHGLSRREVIRKVGLASMVALPLISSIVAPKAINAQSTAGCAGLTCLANQGFEGESGCCAGFVCLSVSFMLECVACIPTGSNTGCAAPRQCCSRNCDDNNALCVP